MPQSALWNGLANYSPLAKSSPMSAFVNKVLLKQTSSHWFTWCLWQLPCNSISPVAAAETTWPIEPKIFTCPFTGMEKAMATYSSSLAWKIPWKEEPGRLHEVHEVVKSRTRLGNFILQERDSSKTALKLQLPLLPLPQKRQEVSKTIENNFLTYHDHEMEPCERESLEWWGMSSLKCESPERGPASWDLKSGTELLTEELVAYLAPPKSTTSAKDDEEASLLSGVKRLPPPLNGSLGGFSEGNDGWKCSAWYLTPSWHLPNSPPSFCLPSLPPAEPKLVCCLNLQRFIHHEHSALCFKMDTDI